MWLSVAELSPVLDSLVEMVESAHSFQLAVHPVTSACHFSFWTAEILDSLLAMPDILDQLSEVDDDAILVVEKALGLEPFLPLAVKLLVAVVEIGHTTTMPLAIVPMPVVGLVPVLMI